MTTNSFGEIKARRDFLPFGDEIYTGIGSRTNNQKYSSNNDDTRQKFATYQRDIETGLDFAQSRYFSPMHGRFTSPDEFKGGPDELFDFEEDASDNPTFYADLENPQSLNKYQYGYNNPYKFNDPTGHCPPCALAPALPWAVPAGATLLAKAAAALGIGAAAGATIHFLRSGPPGAADPSCPACGSSQRMGQSLMNSSSKPEVKSRQTNTATVKAQVGGSVKQTAKPVIPKNKLGPSGKPKVHIKKMPTDKRAKDYARNRGQGPPVKHNNPRKGRSHWHPVDRSGNKKAGKDNVHVESRKKQRGELH